MFQHSSITYDSIVEGNEDVPHYQHPPKPRAGTEYQDVESIPALVVPSSGPRSFRKELVIRRTGEVFEANWRENVADLVPDGKGVLLDVGCGAGKRKWAESKGYKYVGVDLCVGHGVDLLADGTRIPFVDESMAACTSIATMEHVRDPWRACDEIFRVLAPGGVYVGSTAFLQAFHESSYYHMTHLGVREMLERSGFAVASIIPSKYSGFEALARSLLFVRQPVGVLVRLQFRAAMLLRALGVTLVAKRLARSEGRAARAAQFLKEEESRFTSAFVYVAYKPKQ